MSTGWLDRQQIEHGVDILDIIAGTAFICDCSGEEFGSLSEEQLKEYEEMSFYPQIFFMENGEMQSVCYKPEEG